MKKRVPVFEAASLLTALLVGVLAALAQEAAPMDAELWTRDRLAADVDSSWLESPHPEIPAVIDSLRGIVAREGEEFQTRFNAVHMLGAAGPHAAPALPALAELLTEASPNDPYAQLRVAAADAIGKVGPASEVAVGALLSALEDPSYPVHVVAAGSLGKGGSDVILTLRNALWANDVPDEVRCGVYWALHTMGEVAVAALPELALGLETPGQCRFELIDPVDPRLIAAEALVDIGPKGREAIPTLVLVLETERDPKLAAALAYAIGSLASGEYTFRDMRFLTVLRRARQLTRGRHFEFAYGTDPGAGIVEPIQIGIDSLQRLLGLLTSLVLVSGLALLAAISRLGRRIRVFLGQRWFFRLEAPDHVVDVTLVEERIVMTLSSRGTEGSALTRFRARRTWPPDGLERVREAFRPGESALVRVDREIFWHPWETVLGSPWSDGRNSVVAGKVRAAEKRLRRHPGRRHIVQQTLRCAVSGTGLPRLGFAAPEAEAVSTVFRRWGARVHLGRHDATTSEVCEALHRADLVHVAAHASPKGIEASDGVVDAGMLDTLKHDAVRCRLLVLSGCQAGGLAAKGRSLVEPLLELGVTVLAGRTEVDDVVCRRFFAAFYHALLPRRRRRSVVLADAIRRAADECDRRFARGRSTWEETVDGFVLYGSPMLRLEIATPPKTADGAEAPELLGVEPRSKRA